MVRRDMSEAALHVEYDFYDDIREVICSLLDNLTEWGHVLEYKKASVKIRLNVVGN